MSPEPVEKEKPMPQGRGSTKPPRKPKKKLRLVKVVLQPVFVIDDGGSLEENAAEPITVSAAEWADYPATLERKRKETETALNKAA
jgi:hypothetical protein